MGIGSVVRLELKCGSSRLALILLRNASAYGCDLGGIVVWLLGGSLYLARGLSLFGLDRTGRFLLGLTNGRSKGGETFGKVLS